MLTAAMPRNTGGSLCNGVAMACAIAQSLTINTNYVVRLTFHFLAMKNNVVPRFLKNQRGGAMLMEGWKIYTIKIIKRLLNGQGYRQYWKCNCRGSSYMDVVPPANEHGAFLPATPHAPWCAQNQQTTVCTYYCQQMLQEVKEYPTRDFAGIYSETILHLQHNFPTVAHAFPTLKAFSSTVSRIRLATLPLQPSEANLHLLYVPPPYDTTIGVLGDGGGGGEAFFLHSSSFQ
jgi:hypothetical protein